MKKLAVLFSMAAIAMLALACDPASKDEPKDPTEEQQKPDQPGPEEPGPDQPGPDQPGPDEPGPTEPETTYIKLENAACGYYGDYYESGTGDYFIQFYTGEIEDGYLVGEATSIIVDLFTNLSSVMSIPAGEYVPSESYEAFTFETGHEVTWQEKLEQEAALLSAIFGETITVSEIMGEYGITRDQLGDMIYDSGADFFRQDAEENYIDRAIKEGTITVENNGGNYVFKFDFTIDGEEFHYMYEGELPMENYDEGGSESDETEFAGTFGYAYNYGESWPGATSGYNIWSILGYTDTTGQFIELDFVSDASYSTELQEGHYEIVDPKAQNIVPGVAIGYYEEYGYGMGCWYGDNGSILYEGNTGYVDIAKDGSDYAITFSFKDEANDIVVKGTLNGPVTCYDYSESSVPTMMSRHSKNHHNKRVSIRKK